MKKEVFCLIGPTAIGKTDLACALTDALPLEIINVDAALMYQELNIGTAKPSDLILESHPHHLVNCCDLTRVYSVADFFQEANALFPKIWARGKYPLLVGGTMMYFNALQNGLAHLPDADVSIRAALEEQALIHSWDNLHSLLKEFDLKTYKRIHPHDKQRIIRAHEIYQLTGKSWSDHLESQNTPIKHAFTHLGLLPTPRAWLHERIEKRFLQMMQQGFLDEVAAILSKPNINIDHPALRSVGYRQAIAYLNGQASKVDWPMQAIFATRQLAKRQMTWMRRFNLDPIFEMPNSKIEQETVALIQKIIDNN